MDVVEGGVSEGVVFGLAVADAGVFDAEGGAAGDVGREGVFGTDIAGCDASEVVVEALSEGFVVEGELSFGLLPELG